MTKPPRYDAKDVKGAAEAQLRLVAETVLGTIKKPGAGEWRWTGKESPFGAVTMNAATGRWHAKAIGEGGDVLALWARHMGLPDTKGENFGAVLSSLGGFLGVAPVSGKVDDAERSRQRAAIARQKEARDDAAMVEAAKVEAQRAAILSELRAAAVPVEGTPAQAYLRSRGITAAIPSVFAAFIPSGALPRYRRGMVASDAAGLVVWARDAAGDVIGAQRILLTADGRKMPVETDDGPASKFTTGRGDGARIALPALAPSNMGGAIIAGEGPETALSLWQATGAETWAVFGSSGWAGLAHLLPRGRRVILCPDADAVGSPAHEAFTNAVAAIVAAGIDAWVAETPPRYGPKADAGDVLERDGNEAVRAVVEGATRGVACDLAARGHLARLKGSAIGGEAPRVEVNYLPLKDASARVEASIDAAFEAAQGWHARGEGQDDDTPPVHVLRATAGLGKSRALRAAINARVVEGIPDEHAVYVAVPTRELAGEAREAFARAYPSVPSMVFRGRSAPDPSALTIGPGKRAAMCAQSELAEAVAGSGLSVRPHLCEGKSGAAWCREGCRYLGQASMAARVVFLSHEYLRSGVPDGMPRAWAIAIDENFNRAKSAFLTAETLATVPAIDFEGDDDPQAGRAIMARMKGAGEAAAFALMGGDDIGAALRMNGLTVEDAERFAAMEARAAAEYETSVIEPTMGEASVLAVIETRERIPARHSGLRARFWQAMAARWDEGGGQRVSARMETSDDGEQRPVVRVFYLGQIRINAPILIIDADACPLVTKKVYPGRVFQRVDVRLRASVTQITDSAVSKHKLLRADGCEKKRRAFGAMVAREVLRAGDGGALVVACKAVAIALVRDERPGERVEDIEVAAKAGALTYRGASLAWFGPSTRGVDRWKACETVVILGNHMPPPVAVEDAARALFGDDPDALDLIGTNGSFPVRQEGIAMRSGAPLSVDVRYHPDARADALLRQFREQSSIQAIARIRAIHCDKTKRIVILSNVPLPGVEVDHLTTWEDFAPGRFEAAVIERMEACARRCVPFGLRLSSGGISSDAPGEFPSPKAAECWLARGKVNPLTPLIEILKGSEGINCYGSEGINPICVVELRLKGQRGPKSTPAVIACDPSGAKAAAAKIWGPVASCKVVEVHGAKSALPPHAIDAAVDLAMKAKAANLAPLAVAVAADGAAVLASGGDACAVIRKAALDTGSDFGAACIALNLSCETERGMA